MPLKVIVCPVSEAQQFADEVDATLATIEDHFLHFNRKYAGKRAEVSRSVTFLATEGKLVCILYYMWRLADEGSGLLVPAGPAPRERVQ